jgi:DNA-binding NtrC family response regulator
MATKEHQYAAQVLIVDDEVAHAEVMAEALRRMGHVCTIVNDLATALDELKHGSFDLIVTDLVMEGENDGLEILQLASQTQTNAETIMVTAHGDIPTAKKAIKQYGAYDFIEKPLDLEEFRFACDRALQTVGLRGQNQSLLKQVDDQYGLEGIIGVSPAMQQVTTTVRQIAPSDISILVTGESGTGKELIARAIHQNSDRVKKHFKPLNCAGLSESILESELFGHIKGSFTGAERDRVGVFEYADGGTLFLDEIGDMPTAMQAKLLRVLESGEIVRVGSNEPKHVNVRLISATNHDLQELIKQGRFREDLYFRITGANVHLPALRDRREDIPLLVRYYLNYHSHRMNRPTPSINDQAMHALMQFDWTGNVRQLINVIQNMVLICPNDAITIDQVPGEIRSGGAEAPSQQIGSLVGLNLDQIEKHAIRNALRVNQGNREATATMLGIGERTLYRKLKEYGIK